MKITFIAKISKSGEYLIIRVPKSLTPSLANFFHKKVKVSVEVIEDKGG